MNRAENRHRIETILQLISLSFYSIFAKKIFYFKKISLLKKTNEKANVIHVQYQVQYRDH